jgi:hypothetical protein
VSTDNTEKNLASRHSRIAIHLLGRLLEHHDPGENGRDEYQRTKRRPEQEPHGRRPSEEFLELRAVRAIHLVKEAFVRIVPDDVEEVHYACFGERRQPLLRTRQVEQGTYRSVELSKYQEQYYQHENFETPNRDFPRTDRNIVARSRDRRTTTRS